MNTHPKTPNQSKTVLIYFNTVKKLFYVNPRKDKLSKHFHLICITDSRESFNKFDLVFREAFIEDKMVPQITSLSYVEKYVQKYHKENIDAKFYPIHQSITSLNAIV